MATVAMVDVLDAFRKLDDPQKFVFGGIMFGRTWDRSEAAENARVLGSLEKRDDAVIPKSPHFPILSGAASPGSHIGISLSDEAGVVRGELSIYSDAAGNWVAPFENVSSGDTTWLVQISISQAAWSGSKESKGLILSLPEGRILSHEDIHSTEDGQVYGVILATDGSSLESEITTSW